MSVARMNSYSEDVAAHLKIGDNGVANLEVYATVTIFVEDTEQLFYKLVARAALQSFGRRSRTTFHILTDFQ